VDDAKLPLLPLLDSLREVLPKVYSHVELHGFLVTSSDLEEVMGSVGGLDEQLSLEGSEIWIEERMEFGEKFKMKELKLDE
jgi:hypothetical protein